MGTKFVYRTGMLSGLPYALIYVEPDEMAFRGMAVIWIETLAACIVVRLPEYRFPSGFQHCQKTQFYESHTILAQGDISDICFMLLFSSFPHLYSRFIVPALLQYPFGCHHSSYRDLACLLCCFSIHSSHRPVCIRSLCIRASASDTSVESRLTRFAMVNSHHRYLAEFTGHIVDVLVCTLNLCLLWTWLLRIRLCRKTRLVFNAFGPFVSNSICGPVAFKNVHYGGSSVQLFPNMGSFAFH